MKGCRPLSSEEISSILAAIAANRHALRDRALFILGHRTGFRISELLSLKIGDVFREGKALTRVVVARKAMKGQKEARTVELHPEAREAIETWVRELGNIDPVVPLFQGQKGSRALGRKAAWHMLKIAYKKCGLQGKLATHSMRKTFARRVHKNLGENIFKTQKAMGHKSVNSTASYLAVDEDEISNAILKD